MKKDIHPTYHKTKVVCACGNKFEIGSTQKEINTEICAACHPFYTGKQNLIDTAGRLERYEKMVKTHKEAKAKISEQKNKAKSKKSDNTDEPDNEAKLKEIRKKLSQK